MSDGGAWQQLDYVYTPSADVAGDVRYFTEVLGAELGFAIEGMGARVAMVRLGGGPPHLLLADHLVGERPALVYRVADLRKAVARLRKRGLKRPQSLEIPMGPCSAFTTPSGHRFALYELARPGVLAHFMGRKDF